MDKNTDYEETLALKLKNQRKLSEFDHMISKKWYNKWIDHLQGGKHPGKLEVHRVEKPKSSTHLSITQEELEYLKVAYGSPSSNIPKSYQDLNELETPKASIIEIKLPSSIIKKKSVHSKKNSGETLLSMQSKPCTKETAISAFSTNQSINRSFSVINEISKKTEAKNKINFWCDGNMSILNCCLNILVSIDELSTYFTERYFSGIFKEKPLNMMFSSLYIVKSCMVSGIIDTSRIKEYIQTVYPSLECSSYVDLFRFILDELSLECEETGIILKYLFYGKTCREIRCLTCMKSKSSEEFFSDLVLEVSKSVEMSLEFFNREGRISNYCQTCNVVTNCAQRLTIVQQPAYLLICLKRFVDLPYLHKMNTFCKVKKKLVINDDCFRTISIIVHQGDVNDKSYILLSEIDGKWYEFEDKKVNSTNATIVFQELAYMVLYKKNN